jgi:hypothetical protein
MNELPAAVERTNIATLNTTRVDEPPAAVYLARLNANNRRTMRSILAIVILHTLWG